MLLDKKALANLKHIKWVSAQINILNVFSSAQVIIAKQDLFNDLYKAGNKNRPLSSQKDIDKRLHAASKDRERVSLENIETSPDFRSDSLASRLMLYPLRIFGEIVLVLLWVIFWLPIKFLWNKVRYAVS